MDARKKQMRLDAILMILMYVSLLALKIVLVVGNRSFPIISDEFNYEYMSWKLITDGNYASAHYPFLYPLALAPAHLFGEQSYLAMKVLNAVYSSFVPVITYLICRLYLDWKPSLMCGLFSMVLPFQYVFTMCLLSENLYFPLLLLAIYVLLRPYKRPLAGDILIGVFLGLLMLTRHITLSIIPVFAVVWMMKQYGYGKKWGYIFARGFLVVAVLCAAYSPWFVSKLLQGHELKTIVGLSIASGSDPAQLTLDRLLLSLTYYVLYAVLMLAPLLGVLVKSIRGLDLGKKEKCSQFNQLWVLMVGLMGFMLAAVVRHSWKAYYNYPEFTKIKGRYVVYFTVLAAILAAVTLFKKKPKFKHLWCNIVFCYVLPALALTAAFLVEVQNRTSIAVESLIDMYDSIDGKRIQYGGAKFFVVAMIAMLLIVLVYDMGKKLTQRWLFLVFGGCMIVTEIIGGRTYYNAIKRANTRSASGGTITYEWEVMETLEEIYEGEPITVYMEDGVRRRDIIEWLPRFIRHEDISMVEDNRNIKSDTYFVLTTNKEQYEDVLIREIDEYRLSGTDMYMLEIENENKD